MKSNRKYPTHGLLPETAIRKLVDAANTEPRVRRNESFIRRVVIDEAIRQIKLQFPSYFVR